MNLRKIKKNYRTLILQISDFFSIFWNKLDKHSLFKNKKQNWKKITINNDLKNYFKNLLNKKNTLNKKKSIISNKKKKSIISNKKKKSIISNKKKKSVFLKKIDKKSFNKRKSKNNIQINLFDNNILSKYSSNIIIIIVVLIIGLLIFLSFGPYFKIKNNSWVEINKKGDITNMNIAYESIKFIRWESIFNLDKNEIANKLKTYQENIKNVEIDIVLPDKLKILIESYKWLFKTNINWKNYIITENWVLIPSKNNSQLRNLELKTNKNLNNKFLDYKIYFKEQYIQNINEIIKKIEKNIIDLQVEKIEFYEIERELHITTKNDNILLIFNLDSDIEEQIKKLAILKKDYKKIYKTPLYYIDLRIKYKIFICTKEEEYLCSRNIKNIYSYE